MRIVRSNRFEVLLDALVASARNPLGGVTARDYVVVHDALIGAEVTRAVAKATGIASNVTVTSPGDFVTTIATAVLGDATRNATAYRHDRLTWTILELFDQVAALGQHSMVRDRSTRQRLHVASQLASDFNRAAIYRAPWIINWPVGAPEPSSAFAQLQRDVFSALLAELGPVHMASRVGDMTARLASTTPLELASTLCASVHVLDIAQIAPVFAEAIYALRSHTDVHAYVLTPTSQYCGEVLERSARDSSSGDASNQLHPWLMLTANLVAEADEMALHLWPVVQAGPSNTSKFVDPACDTALGAFQRELLAGTRESVPPPSDSSIQIHFAHSPRREMDALRDAITEALETNASLTPADIRVLVPDLAKYGPSIEGAFAECRGRPTLPIRMLGSSSRSHSLWMRSFLELLALLPSDWRRANVLSWLSSPFVSPSLKVTETESEAEALEEMCMSAGVQRFIDEAHAQLHGFENSSHNSWSTGLRRLATGFALSDAHQLRWFDPLAAGSMRRDGAELLQRLTRALLTLVHFEAIVRAHHTVDEWCDVLFNMAEQCLDMSHDEDVRVLTIALESQRTAAAGFKFSLDLATFVDLITPHVQASSRNFSTGAGHITFAPLSSAAIVPAKFVAVVGMNSGEFPRVDLHATTDLVEKSRRVVGDPSHRLADLHHVGHAVLAAESVFLLSCGASENGTVNPSSVIEAIRECTSASVYEHKLQPFDRAYFDSTSNLYSYDVRQHDIARALGDTSSEHPRFEISDGTAKHNVEAESSAQQIELRDLEAALWNAPKWFVEHTLRARVAADAHESAPNWSELDSDTPLDRWTDESTALRVMQRNPETLKDWLQAAPQWPAPPLGEVRRSATDTFVRNVDAMFRQRGIALSGIDTHRCEVRVGDVVITGSVSMFGRHVIGCSPSKLKRRRTWATWLQTLLANAMFGPSDCLLAYQEDGVTALAELQPPSDSLAELTRLARLARISSSSAIPVFGNASLTYAFVHAAPSAAGSVSAQRAWANAYTVLEKANSRETYFNMLVFGAQNPLNDALIQPEFAQFAIDVFGPLADAWTSSSTGRA